MSQFYFYFQPINLSWFYFMIWMVTIFSLYRFCLRSELFTSALEFTCHIFFSFKLVADIWGKYTFLSWSSIMIVSNLSEFFLGSRAWVGYWNHWFHEAVYLGQASWNMGKSFRHPWRTKEHISYSYITQAIQEKVQESNDHLLSHASWSVVSFYYS